MPTALFLRRHRAEPLVAPLRRVWALPVTGRLGLRAVNHSLPSLPDARAPQPTLLDPDNKLARDVAIMRAEIEELRAKLARMPAVIARAALGIIFCTSSSRRFSDRGFWRINRHRRTRA